MTDINYANLVAQGRAKAIGVPWSDEENHAIYTLKIPADFVREGVVTLEAYEKAQSKDKKFEEETGEKPLNKMSKTELQAKADELGLQYTPSVTVAALREIITNKLNEETATSDEEVTDDSESKEDDE